MDDFMCVGMVYKEVELQFERNFLSEVVGHGPTRGNRARDASVHKIKMKTFKKKKKL